MKTYLLIYFLIIFVPLAIWISWKNPLYFLVIHIISRFVLDSLSSYTYNIFVGHFTLMQSYSMFYIVLLFAYLLLRRQLFKLTGYSVVFYIIFFSFISGLISSRIIGFVNIGSKWIYMWLCSSIMLYSLKANPERKVFSYLSVIVMYPLANQLYHYLFYHPKVDHNISYLGGFEHESSLAFILLGALPFSMIMIKACNTKVMSLVFVSISIVIHIGIYMNNYRTSVVALAFFWVCIIIFGFWRLKPSKKILLMVLSIVLPSFLIIILKDDLFRKFSDFPIFFSNPGLYIDFSGHAKQNHLFSGRIDILNMVISAYIHSSPIQYLFGLGPEAVNDLIGVYSHNEFISALVEHGVIGLLLFLSFVLILIHRAYKTSSKYGGIYIYITSIIYSFILMAFATMPFRDSRSMLYIGMFIAILEWSKIRQIRENNYQDP